MHSSNILQAEQVIFYQSDILEFGMGKTDIKKVLAKNLRAAMERRYAGTANQSALSRDTLGQVSPKTISNYLSANKLQNGDPDLAYIPSPSLSLLAVLAEALQIEVWELLRSSDNMQFGVSEQALEVAKAFDRIADADKRLPILATLKAFGVLPESAQSTSNSDVVISSDDNQVKTDAPHAPSQQEHGKNAKKHASGSAS
jgi:hypothetical protein